MEHLLYSSNEMFSSTHLVRKSKEIFDKLVSNEISKAVILRDGKPNFMLLDFNKYEILMKEFEELKNNSNNNKKVLVKEDSFDKEKEEDELKKALKQLESLNLDQDIKEEARKELEEKSSGEIKEFWN